MTRHIPVTLVVLAGSYPAAAEEAMNNTFSKFTFEDVLAFSNAPMVGRVGVTNIVTPMRSVEDATRVAWREVYPRLKTSHALSIHWDGYPVHPEAWQDSFLKFDYIGPVWPWFTERSVGNSGFSLQSRRFLEIVHQDRVLPMKQPEDITLCRDWRDYLEERYDIAFADEATADQFGVEHGPADFRSFGFHGVWNMLYFMEDADIMGLLLLMERDQWARQQIDTLGMRAMVAGRRGLYRWINQTRAEVMSHER